MISWHESFIQGTSQLYQNFLTHLPHIIGAIALLLIGLIIAFVLQFLTRQLISGLDRAFKRITGATGMKQHQLQQSYAYIISKIVFWCILLLFINAAVNILGWQLLSHWMQRFIAYVPNIIIALLIMLVGFLFGQYVKNIMLRFVKTTSKDSILIFNLIQSGIFFIFILLAIQQLGLNIHIITQITVVSIAALLGGGILAFSLGARSLTANVIAAQYAKKYCSIGEMIKIGDTEGELLEISQTALILETKNGIIVVPAKLLQNQICTISQITE